MAVVIENRLGWVHVQQVPTILGVCGGRLAVEEDFSEAPLEDRLDEVLAKANKDLRTVSRDDLVAIARAKGIDPPDNARKAAILGLING